MQYQMDHQHMKNWMLAVMRMSQYALHEMMGRGILPEDKAEIIEKEALATHHHKKSTDKEIADQGNDVAGDDKKESREHEHKHNHHHHNHHHHHHHHSDKDNKDNKEKPKDKSFTERSTDQNIIEAERERKRQEHLQQFKELQAATHPHIKSAQSQY